jgi:hypothetical protein
LVVLALALPAETILLKALQFSTDAQAAQTWAADLDASDLAAAGNEIDSYPFVYRKELLRAMKPDARAAVWRAYIGKYMRQHPELPSDALNALNAAIAATTPELLSGKASKATTASANLVAEQVQALLGKETARLLLYSLGPMDANSASREPLTLKLASYVRNHFVVRADFSPCDCAMTQGCYAAEGLCQNVIYCVPDENWPMCGWWWGYACDGHCE